MFVFFSSVLLVVWRNIHIGTVESGKIILSKKGLNEDLNKPAKNTKFSWDFVI